MGLVSSSIGVAVADADVCVGLVSLFFCLSVLMLLRLMGYWGWFRYFFVFGAAGLAVTSSVR